MSHCTCPKDGSYYCRWCQALAQRANLVLAPSWALAPAQRLDQPPGDAEADLQQRLRTTATAAGYLYYHTYNSKRSDPGMLDSVIVHPDGGPLFLWELKRQDQRAQPSPAQRRWLVALARATSIHTAVFRPSDWQTMLSLLAQHAGPGAAGATPDAVSG